MSFELKQKGNALFKEGDYNGAEEMYSQAIQKNSTEPTFFTNRALTRIRLENWTGTEHDARAAIALYGAHSTASLKSAWYLAQALLGQQRPQEAHEVAVTAYRLSLKAKEIKPKDSQTENLSRVVLRAKQAVWAAKETARVRELDETLASVEGLIEREVERGVEELRGQLERGEIGAVGFGEEQKEIRGEWEEKGRRVREVFGIAGEKKGLVERVVPDYLIDGITFEIMHDPVITPSGTSFDRVSITKYVEQAKVDPITREAMTVADLRPNYALKAACEEFLERNGWAVDW
ncbi:U-box domain protein [Aspergillus sclerotiicarbonarius CBS 121057]|uniref:U-box domain protein n=1 Tax=Aspergillus sclerotiicarbonarius (strain CBS 121057 / IBT 28362) TaxID=1448318 RepID=A0A319EN32_ASPSB|nr:U-box domain protein [Aspergillus sclerotiicarbonarius CBS 121057]